MDQDIASLCNYAFYVNTFLQDYDQARDLYSIMLDYMNHRGVENVTAVLYSEL